MKPIIAITSDQVLRSGDEWAPRFHGQFSTYIQAIIDAGGTPFLVPVFNDLDSLRQLYEKADGLLLSGGGDISPSMYGAKTKAKLKNSSPIRDKQEEQLLLWSLEDNKPVLGICRGMEIINVCLGGTLHQNILEALPDSHNHEVSAHQKDFSHIAHHLKLQPNTKLRNILSSSKIKTNALHHQAIDKLGKNLKVSAYAEDGIIEGIELPEKRFVIGVQSHPEALQSDDKSGWYKLFKTFVEQASLKQAPPVQ